MQGHPNPQILLSHHPARPQGLWDGSSCLNRGRMCLVSPAAVGYRAGAVVVADWDGLAFPVYSVLEIGPAPATCTPIHGGGMGEERWDTHTRFQSVIGPKVRAVDRPKRAYKLSFCVIPPTHVAGS